MYLAANLIPLTYAGLIQPRLNVESAFRMFYVSEIIRSKIEVHCLKL